MQADWEFDLGDDASLIDAAWPSFVDLRTAPQRIHEISEAAAFPALAGTLLRLNSAASHFTTSKCDVWTLESLEAVNFYRFDLDAEEEQTAHAIACYIDLLPHGTIWSEPAAAESLARALCASLQQSALRCCRADLVIRRAQIASDMPALGITAYLIACGATEEEARAALAAALHVFADAVLNSPTPTAAT